MNKLARCFLTFSFLLVILLTSSRCVGISSIMRGAETATVEDGTDVAGVPTSSPTPSQTATKTPFPTASDTPTPTITPTPTLTLMPSPTATPTLPAASSAPNGSGVVTVIEYEDKILGLNQHGWAEMEFIDGKWVAFVREISLAGGNREVWENIPHHLLEDIDVNSIVRYRVEGTDFVSKRAGNTLIEYQGRELPHNEDGQLAWGYLYTERMMYTGPNTKVDRTDNGVPDQAYISGFVRGVFSGPNGWERLIVEIPSPKNPTLRQIFMFILPDQKNTHSNTYVVGEDGLVHVMDARSLHYYVMLEKLKAPEAAGVQIVISLPLNDPDERDRERNRRNAEIISAIQSGDYFDLDGVNINSGIEVGNGPWWIWISELIMQGAW